MSGKTVRFQLWQASTGKVYELSADRNVLFAHGQVYGCGDEKTVMLTTNGNERQTITLQAGWNWTSFNLDLRQYEAKIEKIMTSNEAWTEGDLIKNPATRHFVIYSDSLKRFVGDFDYLRYIYTYMIYSKNGNTVHISGNNLPADSMYVTVQGNGQWSAMPCLLNQATTVTEALSDYYDKATPGDLLKSHDRFAYFSEDKKWEGNLTTVRPGEGYLFRRMAQDTVKIRFYNRSAQNNRKQQSPSLQGRSGEATFSNPNAATNMTMIARVEKPVPVTDNPSPITVYVGDELAAIAEPIKISNVKTQMSNGEAYYFLTIQSDNTGTLRFETEDGQELEIEPSSLQGEAGGGLNYYANAHVGSLKAPVILRPTENRRPYKVIEDQQVIIIRNNEKYDVIGKKLE